MSDLSAEQIATVTFDKTAEGYDPAAVDTFLTLVAKRVWDLESDRTPPAEAADVPGQAEDAAASQNPDVVERALGALRSAATQSAAEIVEAATEQAEQIVAQARQQAEALGVEAAAAADLAAKERLEELLAAHAEELSAAHAAAEEAQGRVSRLRSLAATLSTALLDAAAQADSAAQVVLDAAPELHAGTEPGGDAAAELLEDGPVDEAVDADVADPVQEPAAESDEHDEETVVAADSELPDEETDGHQQAAAETGMPVSDVDVDDILGELADDVEVSDIDTTTPLTAFMKLATPAASNGHPADAEDDAGTEDYVID